MKQIEFEEKLREMRREKVCEISAIEGLQRSVKLDMTAHHDAIAAHSLKLKELDRSRMFYAKERLDVERKWRERIAEFVRENSTSERVLSDVSPWRLIAELHARGFRGDITNPFYPVDTILRMNVKLNGGGKEAADVCDSSAVEIEDCATAMLGNVLSDGEAVLIATEEITPPESVIAAADVKGTEF